MEAPERIYLQTGLESWDDDSELTWDDLEEVTWCVDRINDNDVEYVRKDVAAGLREMVGDLLGYATEAGRSGRDHAARIMLGETDWLVEGNK